LRRLDSADAIEEPLGRCAETLGGKTPRRGCSSPASTTITASGWVPMGEEHRLTKTEGQAILEIDGEPVREV
jgi:hypothetical protein